MRVLVLSDLHVDVRSFPSNIFNDNDMDSIVIIPGDVCPINHIRFSATLSHIGRSVKHVLFVPGNHEYYNCDIVKDKHLLNVLVNTNSNVHVLDNKSIVIDGVKFIGSTLWTNMNNSDFFTMKTCKNHMNDFWIINNNGNVFSPAASVELHNIGLQFIKDELKDSTTNNEITSNIVITHHAPSYASVTSKYKTDPVNPAFASELSEVILNSDIKYWIHGHMHSMIDYMMGNTRVICNPRGYNDNENPGFNPKFELII